MGGEALNRIEKGLDDINADMKEADKHITQMEKWCGLCLMPWNRRKKIKDVDDSKWEVSKSKDGQVTTRQPPGGGAGAAGGSGPYIQRITDDAREDEMEADMGNEIDKQNKQIDKIGAKASNADLKVKGAT